MDVNKTLESIQNQIKEIQDGRKDKIAMIVFSGDLDKLLASFIIATGSVAMGMEAVMF
ncbi:MAG TPA: DsrE/DsrF/DrsH-like family protein, partial [Spirochaetota bacterium]|nr:DsrE/DsrF/DrsH-like family protein [Spirochaetota bacterium]